MLTSEPDDSSQNLTYQTPLPKTPDESPPTTFYAFNYPDTYDPVRKVSEVHPP